LATEPDWEVPPFAGELRDGAVWGRGALDMKGQVAASAVAIASLAREGFHPRGDLLFVANADEEQDDGYGLRWLVETHPDAVRCDLAINEGQGDRVELGGKAFYLCSTAEKMTAPFRLRVHGRSGHASMPSIADNALVNASRLVERIAAYRPDPESQPEVDAFFRAATGDVPQAHEALARARALDPLAVLLVEPLLAPTFSPTIISASAKRNVIPALCEVEVDCRLPPGKTPADVEAAIRGVLGDDLSYDLEWIEARGGTRSPFESPLWAAIESFVGELEPEARAVPVCSPGFTDSHWLREAYGATAYGFFPARAMPAEVAASLIHSANERVPVDDLELGLAFLRHAAREVCG
jgi:acetylornithine deacetylase/succinyl-diaminopimelate desuccinylase-like protein